MATICSFVCYHWQQIHIESILSHSLVCFAISCTDYWMAGTVAWALIQLYSSEPDRYDYNRSLPSDDKTEKVLWGHIVFVWFNDRLRLSQNGLHFANDFSKWILLKENLLFRIKIHWNLFLRVQLTISRHWSRQWRKTGHFLTSCVVDVGSLNDDVIKWKHFPRYWPFVRGIHRWPVNSPHKGQWRGAVMFSLICA